MRAGGPCRERGPHPSPGATNPHARRPARTRRPRRPRRRRTGGCVWRRRRSRAMRTSGSGFRWGVSLQPPCSPAAPGPFQERGAPLPAATEPLVPTALLQPTPLDYAKYNFMSLGVLFLSFCRAPLEHAQTEAAASRGPCHVGDENAGTGRHSIRAWSSPHPLPPPFFLLRTGRKEGARRTP